ncbi:hypothetical protein YC2023_114584 [Brassica napus]
MYQNHPPAENVDKPSSRYHPPPQPFTTQESQPPSPEKKAKTLETKAGRPSRVTTRRRRQNRPTTEEKSASPETKTDLENFLIPIPCERLNLGTRKVREKILCYILVYHLKNEHTCKITIDSVAKYENGKEKRACSAGDRLLYKCIGLQLFPVHHRHLGMNTRYPLRYELFLSDINQLSIDVRILIEVQVVSFGWVIPGLNDFDFDV